MNNTHDSERALILQHVFWLVCKEKKCQTVFIVAFMEKSILLT